MFHVALTPVLFVYVGPTGREVRGTVLGSLPPARAVATSPSFSRAAGGASEQRLWHFQFLVSHDTRGSIPLTFHCDGAEFYNDTEYIVWSVGSFLATGIDVPRLFLFDLLRWLRSGIANSLAS